MNKFSYSFEDKNTLFFKIENGKIGEWSYGVDKVNDTIHESNVNVFYNYYRPQSEERYKEIIFCFDKILNNKSVDNFYVLCSDDLLINDDKLIKIKIDGQPKFSDIFNIVNFNTKSQDINIILNSDCYIDDDNIKTIKRHLEKDDAFVLSRWDILNLNPFKVEHFNRVNNDNSGCSQDAWIFKGQTKKGLCGNFQMGRAGCDNSIAYEFDKSGYNVSNPSFTIKIYHYHLSNIRTYGDYGHGFDNRDKFRVPPPYKFVPSTGFLTENMNVVFYNDYHNGDIHYSREFIKDIMKKYKGTFSYYLNSKVVKDYDIIKDIDINIVDTIPSEISEESQISIINDTIYINTWVGQRKRYFVNKYGINLEANYQIYKEIYRHLNIDIEVDMNFYVPSIDYEYFETKKIDKFLDNKKDKVKVLISNGEIMSAQSEKFDMNLFIGKISKLFPDVLFILTDSSKRINEKNIFYTDDIIKSKKNDLNEISYLSTFCNVLIGRSSGPYAFSMVKENLFDEKKVIICLCDTKDYEWYISKKCRHIISNKYKENDIVDVVSKEIDFINYNKEKTQKRIAFTIIFNGKHHLEHKNYSEFLAQNFDYWIIVEGASKNKGSTSWCREMPLKYHNNGKSIDGTIEHIRNLQKKYNNIIFIESNGMWESKDDMVNSAVEEVKKLTNKCFLWQIDIDEHWTYEKIIKSEIELKSKRAKTGEFNVFQFVGDNLITVGKDWSGVPFIRLWDWKGEKFLSHEPPKLDTPDETKELLSEKLLHYSFYFEEDVKFKNDWYTDHDGLLVNWKNLKNETNLPQHITYLFPKFKGSKHLKNSNNLDSYIVKFKGENIDYNIFNTTIDNTFVINLKRRTDRIKHIEKEFDRFNIHYERFNAIDGKSIGVSGEVACLRSHLGVLSEAIKKGYKKIAVFEDDVILCNDFLERFDYFISNVPNDWEVLYLGCGYIYGSPKILVKPYIYKIKQCHGCFAMILNNKNGLFNRIIETAKSEQKAIDNYMAEDILPHLNAYVFEPFFVKTLNTVSDISGRDDSYSYVGIDNSFKEIIDIPKFNRIQMSYPQLKTNREICENYLKSGDFRIFVANKSIFDSKTSDKSNVQFFDDYFVLFGKKFTYNGMVIKSV